MARPLALLVRAPGTNCEAETAHAFRLAGAATQVVHVNGLLQQPALLDRCEILCFPGGFSYGDDIAAGQIFAMRLRVRLQENLLRFRDRGGLVLGICNGFQVLIRSGLLDNRDQDGVQSSLTWNTNGRYTARWVELEVAGEQSPFLRGIERLYLPIAHGEGRFVTAGEQVLQQLEAAGQLPLRYAEGPHGGNPNGSSGNVAGMCDRTGRVFGLMPHPERNVELTHHPRWTRLPRDRKPDGRAIFENAVAWFAA